MTGVDELRTVQVVSATPEQIRVSVLGGRTQLDVALPADVAVASFLPELARLIGSRDARRDEEVVGRDERRTFWVLGRIDGGTELAPEQTLRAAGVTDGELLRISQRRALSPPVLYDDVVDAAARLNRASYAPWGATAAGVMAIAGLWACTAVWMYFLVAEALSANRATAVGGALLTALAMAGGAALVHRVLDRTDIATAAGLPAVALSATLGGVFAERFGHSGLAVACAVLLVVSAVYHRVIGTGHWAYLAGAVVFGFGACALLAAALGARPDVVAAAAATTATLGSLAVPGLTARLGQSPAPADAHGEAGKDRAFDDPFALADETGSGAAMPSAEEVSARVRWAALTRAGLFGGLAVVVVTAAVALLRTVSSWPALVFALTCAAALALRSRSAETVPQRATLAVPAAALVFIACAQVQAGPGSLPLGGIGVLLAIATVAVLAGLVAAGGRLPRWVPTTAAYLEYVAVTALIPLALWPLGIYDRMGL